MFRHLPMTEENSFGHLQHRAGDYNSWWFAKALHRVDPRRSIFHSRSGVHGMDIVGSFYPTGPAEDEQFPFPFGVEMKSIRERLMVNGVQIGTTNGNKVIVGEDQYQAVLEEPLNEGLNLFFAYMKYSLEVSVFYRGTGKLVDSDEFDSEVRGFKERLKEDKNLIDFTRIVNREVHFFDYKLVMDPELQGNKVLDCPGYKGRYRRLNLRSVQQLLDSRGLGFAAYNVIGDDANYHPISYQPGIGLEKIIGRTPILDSRLVDLSQTPLPKMHSPIPSNKKVNLGWSYSDGTVGDDEIPF
jgi:hypothetical protein